MTDKADAGSPQAEPPDSLLEQPGFSDGFLEPVSSLAAPYRVLARKYRPATFDDLVGQDAMVRTLRNAFRLGRVAHAFMLTGVRGVGKTTTARIIARALNCTGLDGQGGPTADPCGVCANCVAILKDRHPDVLEMDAASRTGVDDVREIIEATRFRPMQGRMKVFIIDEVHMLSRNAFNALLKTLEEPPAQVTFIFATTELRKVPVTVLSRCQRFDLRRVAQSDLVALFQRIAEKEALRLSSDALALIARAADGSVRDGLSLLDQAATRGTAEDEVSAAVVTDMLGLADRQVVFDLLEAVMTGKPDTALALADAAHARGADPGLVLNDILDLIHTVSRLRAVPGLRDAADMPEAERVRGAALADSLPVPVLMRAWQMLVKGIQEVEQAPDRRAAADMVLIRLCYVADLPSPGEVIKQLSAGGMPPQAPVERRQDAPSESMPPSGSSRVMPQVVSGGQGGGATALRLPEPDMVQSAPQAEAVPAQPRSWREVVALVRQERQASLHGVLRHAVHLVSFAPGHIVIRIKEGATPHPVKPLQTVLQAVTGMSWRITLSQEEGEPTLDEQGAEIIQFQRQDVQAHPLVQAILKVFPEAELGDVKDHALDEYGLPPEEIPDLIFAPVDAELTDEDERPTDPGLSFD